MGLRAYVIRRVLLIIPTLIGVTLLIFAVIQLFSPVQRATLYVTDPKQIGAIPDIIEAYGLDDPVYVQYFTWMRQVLGGNLGYSQSARKFVVEAIITRLPASAEIVMYSAPIIILLGTYLGIKSAVNRDKSIDHITRSLAIIGWSLPSFWLGIVLLAIFYGSMGLFPPGRLGPVGEGIVRSTAFTRYTGINTIDALLNGQPLLLIDALEHLVLPVASLTIQIIALIIRIMRSSMLEALGKGYILTARAKGLDQNEVVNKHARRNAIIPVITVSGILTAGLLTGVVITESVFNIYGVGRFAADAAIEIDIPAVLGFSLFAGIIFVTANLLVDILYAYADPRIRLG